MSCAVTLAPLVVVALPPDETDGVTVPADCPEAGAVGREPPLPDLSLASCSGVSVGMDAGSCAGAATRCCTLTRKMVEAT